MSSPVYTCTIRRPCGATFSSSAAWFSHERDSHFHNFDLWKCEWCTRVFHTEAPLKQHWFAAHASRTPALEYWGPDMLLGPMLGERFWCGFCGSVLCTLWPDGYERWVEEYYKHLEAHFDGSSLGGGGRMATIADWKFLPPTE